MELGEFDSAAAAAEQLVHAAVPGALSYQTAAALVCRSAAAAGQSPQLDQSRKQALIKSLIDRAVAILRQGVDQKWISRPEQLVDPAFEPLYADPAYQQLKDTLDKRRHPGVARLHKPQGLYRF
jgi:hypothetical protein